MSGSLSGVVPRWQRKALTAHNKSPSKTSKTPTAKKTPAVGTILQLCRCTLTLSAEGPAPAGCITCHGTVSLLPLFASLMAHTCWLS